MSKDKTHTITDAPKHNLRERVSVALSNFKPSRETTIIAVVTTVSVVASRIGTRQALGDYNAALHKYATELKNNELESPDPTPSLED